MKDIGLLLGNLARIVRADRPRLDVWDNTLNRWDALGGAGSSSPLLAPGPAPLAAEMVCLPADPPDPVTMAGDFVWLRRYLPNFTLSPEGDITTVEGL